MISGQRLLASLARYRQIIATFQQLSFTLRLAASAARARRDARLYFAHQFDY